MSKVVNVHEAKTHLSRYMELAARGEEIRIGKYGKPMVKLVPDVPSMSREPRRPGILAGKIWIADDFDDPTPELIAAMEEDLDAHSA